MNTIGSASSGNLPDIRGPGGQLFTQRSMGERSDALFGQQRSGDDGPRVLIEHECPIVGVGTEGAELLFNLFPLIRSEALRGLGRPAMPSGPIPSDDSIEPWNQSPEIPKRLRAKEVDGVARGQLAQRRDHRHRLHKIAESRQLNDKRSGHTLLSGGHIHRQHIFLSRYGLSEFNQSLVCGGQRAQLVIFLTGGIHQIGPQ